MTERGRLTAPGDLLTGPALLPEDNSLAQLPGDQGLAELAAKYGDRFTPPDTL